MTFVSWEFIAFFAAVMAGLAILRTRAARQILLLIASVVFYAAGTPAHLAILAIPAVVDYYCALRIAETEDPARRRDWLLLSLVSNLGLLAYFKYANFFIDTVATVIGVHTATLDVALPIGISFFTFKTLSYTIDVYRRDLPPCRSWRQYALFVSFFPELVAGPIVRASVFLPQLVRTLDPSWSRATLGFERCLVGLTKKLLVANRLALFVDPVFAEPSMYAGPTVFAAVIAYSLQIYCDFSGYSDIAIGVAYIIGFDLPENFNLPYLAPSITEFWRRWHITLSQWLRDYLYIPLGGNRRGRARTYVNLFITMLLGGLWHGASWTFVAWGAWHGTGLAIHKAFNERRAETRMPSRPHARIVGWLATYAFVCAGWVLFRAHDFSSAVIVFEKVAGLAPGGARWFPLPLFELLPLVIGAHILGYRLHAQSAVRAHDPGAANARILPLVGFRSGFVLTVWLTVLLLFAPIHTSPFIYFQF